MTRRSRPFAEGLRFVSQGAVEEAEEGDVVGEGVSMARRHSSPALPIPASNDEQPRLGTIAFLRKTPQIP